MYAEIIIPLALPKNYTWSVPDSMCKGLKQGCRVEVTLRNKKYAGIVKRLHEDKPPAFEPRPIGDVLDTDPLVNPEQLKLWEWISTYYMCSEGEVMAAALPAHFKLSSESVLVIQETFGDDFSSLDNDEFVLTEKLLEKKELRLSDAQTLLGPVPVYPIVKRLIDKGVCYVWESLKEVYKPRLERFITLHADYKPEANLEKLLNDEKFWGRAGKQMELLLAYLHLEKTEPEVTAPGLLKKSGASDAQLKALIQKGILVSDQRPVDRLRPMPQQVNIDFTLSEAQEKAFGEISRSLQQKNVCLLHGITSSGKTQIYIRLIEQWLSQGKQVLYLVPEIALTAQIVRRLQKHFGGYLGIYHSRFNQNERFEIWNKVRSGEVRILLGARSGLFLPFKNLGLVIVDEEHDASFKQQDPAPRYHARDAAIYYASLFQAKVLLGSATPGIESYYNAHTGKYGLVSLYERFGQVAMPSIRLIDTKMFQRKNGSNVICTPQLKEAITGVLDAKRQVILFRNRRGYSPYQVCKVCSWIPQCKQCDVSLTYHKGTNRLLCHYCGNSYPTVNTCAACGSTDFLQKNYGTEKIEEELEELFPAARIARMDMDTVRGKTAHDTMIRSFEDQRIDILVGTQMVVKGLDFERVDLVGILDADSLLHFAEFRVNERAFQMMEQVSGRAGRKDGLGRVLIQVAETKHPVLQYVISHDYTAFYIHEIAEREKFAYPPFTRVIQLRFRHRIRELAQDAAALFALQLGKDFSAYLTGPGEPPVNRIRNQYIMELMLRLPKDGKLLAHARGVIAQQKAILAADKKFRSVTITPDMDPV